MIDIERFVGLSNKAFSAHGDLETPSKKILLKIARDKGIEWCKDRFVDFYFTNRAVVEAINYAKSVDKGEPQDPIYQQTMMFGFLVGVIDYIGNKEYGTEGVSEEIPPVVEEHTGDEEENSNSQV